MRIKVHRSAKIDLLEGKLFYVEGVIRVYAVLDNRADPQSNDERLGAAGDLNP